MNSRSFIFCALIAAPAAAEPGTGMAGCDVRSGPKTAALVELYTSEGCSSCPPADQQLSRLRQVLDSAAEAVPLALHVGYWDYIGWKDPYAQTAFAERQGWLVRVNQHRTVYTPQFFVNGSELRSGRDALRDKVRQQNALPAVAVIHVRASIAPNGALALNAEATSPAGAEPAALYLAIADSGVGSKGAAGRNNGEARARCHGG